MTLVRTLPDTASAAGPLSEVHPPSRSARLIRSLRRNGHIRGWGRLAEKLVLPDGTMEFLVRNDGVWFAGDLGSHIERLIYLHGGYERDLINLFLKLVPEGRRDVALDVGSNIGTHGLRFARDFRAVHCFEPNPSVYRRLERNAALNPRALVHLHKVGLADVEDELDFYSFSEHTPALGTFSTADQYNGTLNIVGRAQVVRGDDYLRDILDGRVDAVKIDVQGYEPQVMAGLREILERDRPYVWFENWDATRETFESVAAVRPFIPFDFKLLQFVERTPALTHRFTLEEVPEGPLPNGDFVAVPV